MFQKNQGGQCICNRMKERAKTRQWGQRCNWERKADHLGLVGHCEEFEFFRLLIYQGVTNYLKT